MKVELRNNKDVWSGMMFMGTGAVAIMIARAYPFGTTVNMGPGYFPSVLGGILILLGSYVMVRGLRRSEKIQGNWSLRALIILPLSMVLFGILIQKAGFLPAVVALIFGSAASGREFKFIEILLLTSLMTVIAVAIFIWGLGLPYALIRKF